MRTLRLTLALGVAALMLAAGRETQAGTITLNAVDSGWHRSDGLHQSLNTNYIVGDFQDSTVDEYRNWFVFDLSGVTETIVGAQLRLANPIGGYGSPDASEVLSFFDVFVSIPVLTADNSGGSGITVFNGLGTGTLFGSRSVSAADDGTNVITGLNSNALSSLNSAGGLWAISGRLTSIDNLFPNESMFTFTGFNDDVRQLVLETRDVNPVPEPSSLALFGLGAVGALGAARRRRNAA